jgi:hypothetical protein
MRLSVDAPLQLMTIGDQQLLRLPPQWFYARITGNTLSGYRYKHSWVESQFREGAFEDKPDGRAGSTTTNPAYNFNNIQTSNNTIVLMFPGYDGDFIFITQQAATEPSLSVGTVELTGTETAWNLSDYDFVTVTYDGLHTNYDISGIAGYEDGREITIYFQATGSGLSYVRLMPGASVGSLDVGSPYPIRIHKAFGALVKARYSEALNKWLISMERAYDDRQLSSIAAETTFSGHFVVSDWAGRVTRRGGIQCNYGSTNRVDDTFCWEWGSYGNDVGEAITPPSGSVTEWIPPVTSYALINLATQSSAATIHGIYPYPGKELFVQFLVHSGESVTLKHNSGSATGLRIISVTGSDIVLNTAGNFLVRLFCTDAFSGGSGVWIATPMYAGSLSGGASTTDEDYQDAVGGILDNGTSGQVEFTYDDATPEIHATLKDDSVTNAQIQDDAITTLKIIDDAVTTAKIIDDAVTTSKIADAQITAAKLGSLGITGSFGG